MISRRGLLALVLLAALAIFGVVAGLRRRAFDDQIDREIAELLAARNPEPLGTISEADLDNLPEPVQRWLQASGVVGSAIPQVVRLTQQGDFRLGAEKPWMPYQATEHFTTNPPGLLWDVSMHMAPMIEIVGRDRYDGGTGEIEMRIASIYPVAKKSSGDLDSGALLRYLNETMWFPAALVLPNVTWEPIDDSSARATLTDAGQSVSAVFHIDPEGHLVNMIAARWNDAEDEMLPWSTPLTDWGTFERITVPTAGSGVWNTGADAYEYIRLRVTNVEYDPV